MDLCHTAVREEAVQACATQHLEIRYRLREIRGRCIDLGWRETRVLSPLGEHVVFVSIGAAGSTRVRGLIIKFISNLVLYDLFNHILQRDDSESLIEWVSTTFVVDSLHDSDVSAARLEDR